MSEYGKQSISTGELVWFVAGFGEARFGVGRCWQVTDRWMVEVKSFFRENLGLFLRDLNCVVLL